MLYNNICQHFIGILQNRNITVCVIFVFRRNNRHYSFAILHAVSRLHTKSSFGRGDNCCRGVYGRVTSRQANVANEKYATFI